MYLSLLLRAAAICASENTARTQLGYAADFCPVCRKISEFRIYRLGVGHVYSLDLDPGKFAGYSQLCMTCQNEFGSMPERFSKLAEKPGSSIEQLAAETSPSIYQDMAERLALERQIAADPHALDAETRAKAMMETFKLASGYYDDHRFERGFDALVTALRPLDPSEEEVRACLAEFHQNQGRMGRMLGTGMVMKALKRRATEFTYDY